MPTPRQICWDGGRASRAGLYWMAGAICALGLLLRCAAQAGEAPAEPLRHAQCDFWQTLDGLPDHDVVSVAQTTDGYIWVGTIRRANSLVRFNGKEFVAPIKLDSGHPGEEDRGACVARGKNGRLWVSQSLEHGGLVLWENGKATRLEPDLPLVDQWAIPLFEDPEENLWIGGQRLVVRTREGRIKDLRPQTSQYGVFHGMAADREGTIWLATDKGLVRCRHEVFDQPYSNITHSVRTVCPASDGSLWLGGEHEHGLTQVSPSGEVVPCTWADGLAPDRVAAICEDLKSNVWVGTDSGLCWVKDRKVYPVQEQDLRTVYIFCLICDSEGSLWAGTADGLYRVRDNPFEYYGPTDSLGPVDTLCVGPSGLWASVYVRGLFRYLEGGWKAVRIGEKMTPDNLVELPDGALWMAVDHRCYRFWQGTKELLPGITGEMRLCADGHGVWIITASDLYHSQGGEPPRQVGHWPTTEITGLVTNVGGGLLIGTTNGVSRWAGRLEPWLQFGADFPGKRANGLEWEGDALWVASEGAIGRYQRGQWQVLRPEAGLAETGGINAMLVDRENIWLGCFDGLFRISRAQVEGCLRGTLSHATVVQYVRTQGVHPGFFGSGSWGQGAARDADGKLWFASRTGAVAINTAIPLNTNPPPVAIESLKLNQQPVALLLEKAGAPLRIPAGTRSVEIGYAALTYVAPERARFKCRLLGLDPDWVSVGFSTVAHYAKLRPGDYEFQVAGCNSDGVWNEDVARLKFVQDPFFYQTPMFLVLCETGAVLAILALALALAAAAHRVSTRKMRRRLALIEAQRGLDRERARIARDIHDDLGSTLTRIVMLTELGRREPEQTHTPNGHLTAIQNAAREITRRLDEIVWAVNPRHDTLEAVATYIEKMAVDQAHAAGLRCRIDFPPSLPDWPLTGNARHSLFLACKEAVHNAIQHAGPSELRLRLAVDEDGLTLDIADNGAGLPAGLGEGAGDGFANLRERLAGLGGTCRIRSAPGEGTTVTFHLPRPGPARPVSTKQVTCRP